MPPKVQKPDLDRKLDGVAKPVDDGPSLTFELDGVETQFYFNRVSAKDVAALRAAIGIGLNRLMSMVAEDGRRFEADTLAALLWLGRRQHGEPWLTFDAVADKIDFEATTSVKIVPAEETVEEPGNPKG